MSEQQFTRRDVIVGAGAMAGLMAAGMSQAEDHAGHNHAHHAPKHEDLVEALNGCLDKGRRCIAHCLIAFNEGDMGLAACAKQAHEMEAVCGGFATLATINSKYVKEYAKICRQACVDCEKECREHDDKHKECRDCADACAHTVKVIDQIFA